MANIFAVDPSLTETGVAWNKGEQIVSRTIASKNTASARMIELRSELRDQLQFVNPDLIVIEAPAFASKGRSVKEIGGIWWQYRVMMYELGMRVLEVPPSFLKKYATGHGNAKKIEVVQAAWQRLDYEGTNDNVADALWLHQIGLKMLKDPMAIELPAINTSTWSKLGEEAKWS